MTSCNLFINLSYPIQIGDSIDFTHESCSLKFQESTRHPCMAAASARKIDPLVDPTVPPSKVAYPVAPSLWLIAALEHVISNARCR